MNTLNVGLIRSLSGMPTVLADTGLENAINNASNGVYGLIKSIVLAVSVVALAYAALKGVIGLLTDDPKAIQSAKTALFFVIAAVILVYAAPAILKWIQSIASAAGFGS